MHTRANSERANSELCTGWFGLLAGAVSVGMLTFTLPMIDQTLRQAGLPAAMITVAKATTVAITVIVYVIIPAGMVLFYRSPHVRRTCETRDPVTRWTDRVPMPVLGAVLMLGFGAVAMLFTIPAYGRAFPLAGMIVTGLPAYALYFAVAALLWFCMRGLYRRERRWWAVTLAFFGVSAVNSIVTFRAGGLMRLYEAAGLSEAQLAVLRNAPLVKSPALPWSIFAGSVALLGYVWWLRRYVVDGGDQAGGGDDIARDQLIP